MNTPNDSHATPALDRSARTLARWCDALIMVVWLAMIWGAATRAARAGLACPDWPLCRGRIVPSADLASYGAAPREELVRVLLEYTHRVIAATIAIGTTVLGVRLVRRGHRRLALALALTLAAQIAMGAITVWLRNAPVTVVAHLALALTFLTTLLVTRARVLRDRPAIDASLDAHYLRFATILAAQLLLGATVSSRSVGLACFDFPLCNGFPVPIVWTVPIALQFAHRVLGAIVLATSVLGAIFATRASAPRSERRLAFALALLATAQVLLGGMNVWFAIPPALSAAHLALAAVLFGLVANRCVLARASNLERTIRVGDERTAPRPESCSPSAAS